MQKKYDLYKSICGFQPPSLICSSQLVCLSRDTVRQSSYCFASSALAAWSCALLGTPWAASKPFGKNQKLSLSGHDTHSKRGLPERVLMKKWIKEVGPSKGQWEFAKVQPLPLEARKSQCWGTESWDSWYFEGCYLSRLRYQTDGHTKEIAGYSYIFFFIYIYNRLVL